MRRPALQMAGTAGMMPRRVVHEDFAGIGVQAGSDVKMAGGICATGHLLFTTFDRGRSSRS
jgi:hypothetical protein